MQQIERSKALADSDCFIHIIKYIIQNNNLYVISQQCLQSLKEYITEQFRFVERNKNTVLFQSKEKYPIDVYDLNNGNSIFGKHEAERQANAHMYLLVSDDIFNDCAQIKNEAV